MRAAALRMGDRGLAAAHRMGDRGLAAALFAALFVLYNANGREMGNYDSQPTKYAARELLLRGTLALNHVVGATPQLGERPAFVPARGGRIRSAYSPVPAMAAAAITWPLWIAGVLDVRAPLGANWIAKLTASLLTAGAVALSFFTARRFMSGGRALALAAALGAGTGYWPTVSQTLWQHETAIFGISLAVFAFTARDLRAAGVLAIGIGLGIAGSSRPQLAPAIIVLLTGVAARVGAIGAWPAAAATGACAMALIAANLSWFGHPMGAMPLLEALHPAVHGTEGTFEPSSGGFAGLLVSPNRGLLIFSPIVAVATTGLPRAVREGRRAALIWCAIAASAQYVLYASYSVWWAGHTFGPRYMLDALPLLAVLAAAGVADRRLPRPLLSAMALALAWSIAVSAAGAFVFPNERWNLHPADVDRSHARLWDWSDLQILRAWRSRPSPQNFSLFVSDNGGSR
jgi:hypothetical protein